MTQIGNFLYCFLLIILPYLLLGIISMISIQVEIFISLIQPKLAELLIL